MREAVWQLQGILPVHWIGPQRLDPYGAGLSGYGAYPGRDAPWEHWPECERSRLMLTSARKQKLIHEFKEYWINVAFLTIFFSVFVMYRRLMLASYEITYLHYGLGLVKALILAKVVLIIDALGQGRKYEGRPLIVSVIYKAFVFTLWALLFAVLEHAVGGLLHGKGLRGGLDELLEKDRYEMLAESMVLFFVFIPFFAFRELGRVLGEERMRDLFFKRRAPGSDPSDSRAL
jgi:hypothetical protein